MHHVVLLVPLSSAVGQIAASSCTLNLLAPYLLFQHFECFNMVRCSDLSTFDSLDFFRHLKNVGICLFQVLSFRHNCFLKG